MTLNGKSRSKIRMQTPVGAPLATEGIFTYALFGGLAVGFAWMIILNYGDLGPSLVRIGSPRWFAVLVMAFMTGYIDTCVGGGHGTLLMPSLVLLGFPLRMIVPGILLSEISIGILATILNCRAGNIHLAHGEQHRHVLLVLFGCSLVGSVIAVTVAVRLSPRLVNSLVGLVIIGTGLLVLMGWNLSKRPRMGWILVLGIVAAFNKGISGGGYGPLLTSGQVLSGVGEKGAVSITLLARGMTGLISVALYFVANGTIEANLALPLITGSLLAMPAAVLTVTKVDAGVLRKGISVVTVALGTLLVVNALH